MKTGTDQHWNERALSVENDIEVNIMDVFQRDLEYEYVCRFLGPEMRILEVGCGNGFSTERFRSIVRFVDAFDYAENMVARAKERVGETNNRFINDNILAPRFLRGPYDAVVCIRVLINLKDLDAQRAALRNMEGLVAVGGLLILAEGFIDGFERLNELRGSVGLPPIEPASINFYSRIDDIVPALERKFHLEGEFHLGMYDYLTRVVYPLIAGVPNVRHNTVFSERSKELARAFNPDSTKHLSRLRGYVYRKMA